MNKPMQRTVQNSFGIFSRIAVILLAGWLLTACASAPTDKAADAGTTQGQAQAVNDPFEGLNRYFYEVNRFLDAILIRPVAEIYRGVVPDMVQDGIRNFFRNFNTPRTFVHDLAQGETERAGQSFGRFTTNSFAGAAGVFDVATGDNPDGAGGIPYHSEDLGQTLAVWGMDSGPYLFLPLLGPSNARDLVGRVGDMFLNPLAYVGDEEIYERIVLADMVLGGIDTRARLIDTLDTIETTSIDSYATIRSFYNQRRRAEISNQPFDEASYAPDISISADE